MTQYLSRADGLQMAYRVLGSGPPVVCVPGGPGADADYLEDLGGLSRHFQLIIPDMRGTGESAPARTPGGYGFATLAEDLDALRDHLGIERMSLLAHSAGCTTALYWASGGPERVVSLVLVAPSGFMLDLQDGVEIEDDTGEILERRRTEPWFEAVEDARLELRQSPPRDRFRELIEALAPASYRKFGKREAEHARSMLPRNWETIPNFWLSEIDIESFFSGISRVEAPVLVVTGDLDAATGIVAGKAWAEQFANARHVTIDECAHIPWVDQPEAFSELVAQFLGG